MFSKLLLLALPLAAYAAPALKPRNTGEITFYHPGLGACGKSNGDGDMVAAIAASVYDTQDLCGKSIKLQGDAGQVTVTVIDRCEACAAGDVDLSPAAFQKSIGDLSVGRGKGTWSFA
ncbi:hypothetical protein NW762_003340 [Fusarium torreyae]|uniref:RlpA-like protein double-psi beta-barrel domain-containing protein n=1 Tax=Fusarium torreyae TaxID=1237075 RepID=A0A9W8S965_9HYPO|nr:hypothetical protein NW762_003340 [Fusarium torreyae]